ncbi:oxidoreductase [Aureobasidium pullulans]|uniref:Oxidoreductase n=1 Tax=Aureobasidium pullulans TaxID=5580 RepID=A0A4S9AIA1_AURPU|nr:oxidoreductase [Aureobasidium pullulans]
MFILRQQLLLSKQLHCSSTRAIISHTKTATSIVPYKGSGSMTNHIPNTRSYASHSNITGTQTPRMHHILIVGGGPAGSSTAFWLAKSGFKVTVAERSTVAPYGQGIDITDEAVDVVKKMGLWDEIKANTTGESGFAMVDDVGTEIGSVGTNPAEEGKMVLSPTNEIEIMRGILTNIFADAAKKQGAEYRYGCTITNIQQGDNSVTATLSDTDEPEKFTAIIGADGVASRVRNLTFDKSATEDCFKQTDTFVAYFSMEVDPADQKTYSVLQHANKGRVIWVRPIDRTGSRVSGYLMVTTTESAELQKVARHGTVQEQKVLLENMFANIGGLREKVVQGMNDSEDFYFTRVVQVKLDAWHRGRCALVGDAGYCPSPLTGQGTTMAVLGAYYLAGELTANPNDPEAAFTNYRKKFEGFVQENGSIPLGGRAPKLVCPQSDLGVWMVRSVFSTMARPGFKKLLASLPSLPSFVPSFGGGNKKSQLPDYDLQVR